jgi:glycosyltransferase involved in cell wall biosynthesis
MFNPQVDGSSIRAELGLQDKLVVLYAGALGQANDIDTILRGAQRLRGEDAIRFVLFGDGKERPRLQSEMERMKLSNVLFAGVRPKKDMPRIVASADVCLAILQDIPMFRTTYPNKVFDYMAAGRATVLVIDGVSRQLIEASDGGAFVQPGDDEALAKTILELSKDPGQVLRMGANAREYLVRHLDRRDKLKETLEFLLKLVQK